MTEAGASPASRPAPPLLVAAAVVVPIVTTALLLSVAGDTLGYDFRAFLEAARRLLDGGVIYDVVPSSGAGAGGLFLYPPVVALALAPLAVLPGTLAPTLVWIALMAAATVGAIALLPVRPWVRWATLLIAGLTWPVIYALKLGQVGPIVLLSFALAWRWLDRPVGLGLAAAAGAVLKLQPILLVPWAAATGRWRAALAAIVALLVIVLASLPFVGADAWLDWVRVMRAVGVTVETTHAVSPGSIAIGLGVDPGTAAGLQWAWTAAAVVVVAAAWFLRDATSSLVITAVASQVISPLLWDHYAMILLLPVALVLDRAGPRAWPVALLPVAAWLPAPIYPLLFAAGLLLAWVVGTPRGRIELRVAAA